MDLRREVPGTRVFIGLGSNLQDRKANLERALELLNAHDAIRIVQVSSFHETAPWGVLDQGDFLNVAAEIATSLDPHELLSALKEIERQMGRRSERRWGPRLIDLDILLYGEEIIRTRDLAVPQAHLAERRFALAPLAEIAPEVTDPNTGLSIRELLEKTSDTR